METLKEKLITGISLTMFSILIVLSGCKKSDDLSLNNSEPKLLFGIKADLTASTTALAKSASNTLAASNITWTSGIANVQQFKFEAEKGNTEIEIKTGPLSNINLFSLDPDLIKVNIDSGLYREIEVKIYLAKSASVNAIPLTLKGSYASSSGAVPIELYINDNVEIKLESENVKVEQTSDLASIVTLQVNKVLAGISASSLEAASKTNGIIVISNTSNTNIYNRLKENIINSCEHKFEKKRHGNDD